MSEWAGMKEELRCLLLAKRNAPDGLAEYLYDRMSAYVGRDHDQVCVSLIRVALSAYSTPEPEPAEGELEACPGCGGNTINMERGLDEDGVAHRGYRCWWRRCYVCRWEGPPADTRKKADAAWNRRSP